MLGSNRSEPPPEYQTPFSELAERYLEDKQRHEKAEALKAQTVGRLEAVYRLFNDHIGGATRRLGSWSIEKWQPHFSTK